MNGVETKITELLKKDTFKSNEIVDLLKIDWSPSKVTSFLKKKEDIITINENPLKFTHKQSNANSQGTLF